MSLSDLEKEEVKVSFEYLNDRISSYAHVTEVSFSCEAGQLLHRSTHTRLCTNIYVHTQNIHIHECILSYQYNCPMHTCMPAHMRVHVSDCVQ